MGYNIELDQYIFDIFVKKIGKIMQAYTDTNQTNVQNASDKQFVNMLRRRATQYNGTLYLNPPALDKIIASAKTDSELLPIPLLGFTNGKLNMEKGFTCCSYSPVKERNDVPGEFWCYMNPEIEMQDGVINVTEKTIQTSW